MSDNLPTRISGCRSDGESFTLDLALVVVDLAPSELLLKSGEFGKLDESRRVELIEAVRAGKHAEITARAKTFRQHVDRGAKMNRNYIRHAASQLPTLATSYNGMPFLLDHAKHSQRMRVGTITASELHDEGRGMFAFKMALRAVKPDAVISILDGTIDRFSIGWHPTGTIVCTLHGNDVRDRNSCSCWPGSKVSIDGVEKIAEYEFQKSDGIECSAVNVPAVLGTKIEDVRAALALELNLSGKGNEDMSFTRLAALLGLAALNAADEDRAVSIISGLQARATQAEGQLAVWQTRATEAEKALTTLTADVEKERTARIGTDVDHAITSAYAAGKLLATKDAKGERVADPQELGLRALAKDPAGVTFLTGFLATMPAKVPLGQRVIEDNGKRDTTKLGEEPTDAEIEAQLEITAKSLGLKVEDMKRNHTELSNGGPRRSGSFAQTKES